LNRKPKYNKAYCQTAVIVSGGDFKTKVIMKPKEKAQQLFNTFFKYAGDIHLSKNDNTKNIAEACIDEILLFSQNLGTKLYQEVGTESYSSRCENANMAGYWKDVKKELEKL